MPLDSAPTIADQPEAAAQLAARLSITECEILFDRLDRIALAETDNARADLISHSAANVSDVILSKVPTNREEVAIFRRFLDDYTQAGGMAAIRPMLRLLLEAAAQHGVPPERMH